MFLCATVALIAAGPGAAAPALQASASVASPVETPAFAADALRGFFGDARGAYLHAEGPLQQQMEAVLGRVDASGPVERQVGDTRDLGNGLLFDAGCRAPSCDEKGAIVYDTRARVVLVAGMIHSGCKTGGAQCRRAPRLTVFTSGRHPVPLAALLAIDRWADGHRTGLPREVHTLP